MHRFNALAGAATLLVCTAAAFAAGNVVGVKDRQLFAKDDERRVALIARACGKSGRLLYDHHAQAYLCLWQNRDGPTVTAEVSAYPYLDQLAQR
ncbi:hypothetical protein CEG14_14985 [Bordetella genomosp. 1]|uniref:Uncharacterized protein n=1 Tax=Bordetella genomosp. 1 TaxID=1395607 RepID=A0A261SIZ7_9BORD|nr:hypothetical protein [Bordetella genomosp. 1]OZI36313.1 hypothetical protein CEG14_14985 [Bordetella genomosp. 1]